MVNRVQTAGGIYSYGNKHESTSLGVYKNKVSNQAVDGGMDSNHSGLSIQSEKSANIPGLLSVEKVICFRLVKSTVTLKM